LKDATAVCEAEIRFWHGRRTKQAPHKAYLFMLNAVADGYGGLEHRQSTALLCNRADLPTTGQQGTPDGYTKLLGLISHEYFHTWNVKRLRPAEFAKYNYAQENYTELLWFFEGFTSYYDDLLLRRAGLIDNACYLKLLSRTINAVLQTPGRHLQSVAQASFDAWVKYYRQDENTSNATISYYTKGSLIALCLDLTLRQGGKSTLDEVMRSLWQRCKAGPMTQADLLAVLSDLTGQSFDGVLQQWVHGTKDLPFKQLLAVQGIGYELDKVPLTDQLGLKLNVRNGIHIKSVARDSAGEVAGFAAEDEWLGISLSDDLAGEYWRLGRIEDLVLYLGDARKFTALVARDQRILTLAVSFSKPVYLAKLVVQDKTSCDAWLAAR
jgi:predicted metalloprotease with PDZ domain